LLCPLARIRNAGLMRPVNRNYYNKDGAAIQIPGGRARTIRAAAVPIASTSYYAEISLAKSPSNS